MLSSNQPQLPGSLTRPINCGRDWKRLCRERLSRAVLGRPGKRQLCIVCGCQEEYHRVEALSNHDRDPNVPLKATTSTRDNRPPPLFF